MQKNLNKANPKVKSTYQQSLLIGLWQYISSLEVRAASLHKCFIRWYEKHLSRLFHTNIEQKRAPQAYTRWISDTHLRRGRDYSPDSLLISVRSCESVGEIDWPQTRQKRTFRVLTWPQGATHIC